MLLRTPSQPVNWGASSQCAESRILSIHCTAEWYQNEEGVSVHSSIHISLPPLKKLKLNPILEIYSTTQFNFTACLSLPELRLCCRCSHQATGWKSRNCVSIPERHKRLFSSSKHFADSGFLFSAYWRFLPRGHSPRYNAEIKNNCISSPPLSRRTEGQICLYNTSQ
jgi:hypothetical protein